MGQTEGTRYDSPATGDRADAMPRPDETARGTRRARRPRYRGLHPRRFEEKYNTEEELARILRENADEPQASTLAHGLAGRDLPTTASLSAAIERIVRGSIAQREEAKRRVFQTLRVAVNGEFQALDALLRAVPWCLKPGGRAVFLTFHSGEDRRVKQSFREGRRDGTYSEVADGVQRPSSDELRSNPRAKSAKLRWAIRAGAIGEEP